MNNKDKKEERKEERGNVKVERKVKGKWEKDKNEVSTKEGRRRKM